MALDQRMLKSLGMDSIEELFSDIPENVRTDGIPLPDGLSEPEMMRKVRAMLHSNATADEMPCFLGGGIYHHHVPAAVRSIAMRSEFITSYTPYQAEISQGMLQSLFEYQSLISELTGMDVVNSSNYDGSTALGEAATMSYRIRPKRKFLIPEALSWEKKSVLRNYVQGAGMELIEYAYDPYTGCLDMDDLHSKYDEDVSGIYVEVPNLFGVIDPSAMKLKKGFPEAVLVVGFNPISLGVLAPPGEYGADIAVGEGQPLGLGMNCGGPLLGLFACKMEHVRKMPGRLIGMTKDKNGDRAYCMTLQTREQHIRRSKATSNICTNEALMALTAAVYLSIVGPRGLRSIAEINIRNASELMRRIDELGGFDSPVFEALSFQRVRHRLPDQARKTEQVTSQTWHHRRDGHATPHP